MAMEKKIPTSIGSKAMEFLTGQELECAQMPCASTCIPPALTAIALFFSQALHPRAAVTVQLQFREDPGAQPPGDLEKDGP